MAQRLVGIRVEKRVIRLPAGFVLEDPTCVDNDQTCCPCCDPAPPDTIYMSVFEADPECTCLPDCITLVYNVTGDAWYSTVNLALFCGVEGNLYVRLKCLVGDWTIALVDGTNGAETGVVLAGVVTGSVCDPFSMGVEFTDSGAVICGGFFSYLIGTADCTPAGITTGCCDNTPTDLFATFAGALSALGSIPLTYNSGTSSWNGLGTGCGIGTIRLECSEPANVWVLSLGPAASATSTTATYCQPFLLEMSGTGSTCAGAFTVTITE